MFTGFVFLLVIRQAKMCSDISHLHFRSLLKQRTKTVMLNIFFSSKNLNSLIWIVPCLPAFKKNVSGKKSYSTRRFFSQHIPLVPPKKAFLTAPTWAGVGYHCSSFGLKTNYKKQIFSNCPAQRPHSQGCQAAYLQTETVPDILTLSYPPVHRLLSAPLGCSVRCAAPIALTDGSQGLVMPARLHLQVSQCRSERPKCKPRRNGRVLIAPCKYMQAWIYPVQCKAPNWRSCTRHTGVPELLLCLYRNPSHLKVFRAACF